MPPAEGQSANFNEDTKNIESVAEKYKSVAVQSAKNQTDKVFSVNVICGGDPLEIYTDREGEVIFKKYSPIGELAGFAAQYAETLHKTCALSVLICDRDAVIACSGVPRKEYSDKPLSDDLETIINNRALYVWREGEEKLPVLSSLGDTAHFISCAMPILAEGDVIGCVLTGIPAGGSEFEKIADNIEAKLIQTAGIFLGKQMES